MRILLLFVGLFLSTLAAGQYTIDSIRFEGLRRTKQFYLEKYLISQKGKEINGDSLKQDQQSLRNLQLFSDVEVKVDTNDEKVSVTFNCKERITLLPITNFGGVKDNFFTQLGFTNYNWLGRGGRLTMYYMYYDRHSFSTSMWLPYIKRSDYGISLNLNKYSTIEPLFFPTATVFYEYDNLAMELLGIREFKLNHTLSLGGTIFREGYKKYDERDFPGSPGPYQQATTKYLVKILHNWKRVDYYYHYLNGISNFTFGEAVWSQGYFNTFVKFVSETRAYKRLGGKGNFAARLKMGLSSNNVGPFAPFVVDSYVNIRGVGNRVDRGTGTLVVNLEHRQTVWQPSWGALQLVVFTDVGSWRQDGGGMDDFVKKENLQTFFGGGARLVLNQIYNSILRIDYGVDFNDRTRNGIVLGIGQYF